MDCDCNKCDFWDNELGCTCPDGDRWYAGACATATEEEFRDEDTQKKRYTFVSYASGCMKAQRVRKSVKTPMAVYLYRPQETQERYTIKMANSRHLSYLRKENY